MSPRRDDDEPGRSLLIPLIGIAAVLLLGAGCAWFFFLRSGDADVSGQVTFEDKAVPGAVVVFVSENVKPEITATALTDADGKYRLVGNTGAGIPRGTYKVAVTQDTLKDGAIPADSKALQQARAKGLLSNRLPSVYSDRKSTPLEFEIRAGANTINLPLKKPIDP